MLLSDIETAVRLDLFDPIGANQRWQTSDIDRAIDKALDRYSSVYPNIVYTDMSTQPYQRTYPYPTPWNAAYPVWWLERILYPLQAYGSQFALPTSGMVATPGAGVGPGIGNYTCLQFPLVPQQPYYLEPRQIRLSGAMCIARLWEARRFSYSPLSRIIRRQLIVTAFPMHLSQENRNHQRSTRQG